MIDAEAIRTVVLAVVAFGLLARCVWWLSNDQAVLDATVYRRSDD